MTTELEQHLTQRNSPVFLPATQPGRQERGRALRRLTGAARRHRTRSPGWQGRAASPDVAAAALPSGPTPRCSASLCSGESAALLCRASWIRGSLSPAAPSADGAPPCCPPLAAAPYAAVAAVLIRLWATNTCRACRHCCSKLPAAAGCPSGSGLKAVKPLAAVAIADCHGARLHGAGQVRLLGRLSAEINEESAVWRCAALHAALRRRREAARRDAGLPAWTDASNSVTMRGAGL